MSPDPGERELAGFTVRDIPDAGCTVYLRAADTPAELEVDVELSHRLTCTLRLLPTVALNAIVVRHGADGPAPADVALAERVARSVDAAALLYPYATALEAAGTPGAGRVWAVELALRALDVVDRLEVDAEGTADGGVWPVWSTMCGAAAQALAEVPGPVQAAGDSALRVEVATMAKRLRRRADRLTSEWLDDLVADWPVPQADTPAEDDETWDEFDATRPPETAGLRPGLRPRVYLGGTERGGERVAVTLSADLEALVRIGLVDRTAGVLATPLDRREHQAWEIRIRVRDAVATAFLALTNAWEEWQTQTMGRSVALTDQVRLDLSCRFGNLLAVTHLPFTLDEFLRSAALVHPAPPHLADVVCLVRADDVVGPVGLKEEATGQRAVDLVAVIPHAEAPTVDTITLTVPAARTPMVSARARTVAQRMLALRRELAEGRVPSSRRARAVRELQEKLEEQELKDALQAEVDAAGRGLTAEVQVLLDAVQRSERDLAVALRAAGERRDLDAVTRLSAHLSRTRAYLTGIAN